jgi:hypothetical protein
VRPDLLIAPKRPAEKPNNRQLQLVPEELAVEPRPIEQIVLAVIVRHESNPLSLPHGNQSMLRVDRLEALTRHGG